MDELRNKLCAPWSIPVAYGSVAVEHGRAVGIRIRGALLMGVEALTDDEVGNTIAVHVCAGRAVRFRESHASRILRRKVIRDHVLHERDVPARFFFLLI